MNAINLETIERVKSYTLNSLSEKRYNHSVSVAETAKLLAQHYSEDEELAYFGGLCHDMCKEMDKEEQKQIIIDQGETLSYGETVSPSVLHGRVCGILLQKDFDINNEILIEAVSHHTFGKNNMHPVSKIICIADKIEPTRKYMTPQKMEDYMKLGLDELLFTVLSEIIEIRRSKNAEIFPEALWIYEI